LPLNDNVKLSNLDNMIVEFVEWFNEKKSNFLLLFIFYFFLF
jgi:hypothetical protein